jgi:protein-S-isoprenylcysteine O-methyltransferase Ste14
MTGMGLAILSWGTVFVLLLASCIVYGYRIHVEEKALVEKVGEEYRAYMGVMKMLIPFILSKKIAGNGQVIWLGQGNFQ